MADLSRIRAPRQFARHNVSRCTVRVVDLKVMADIGVHAHEIGSPQPLILSVALEVIPPRVDRLDEAFDYTAILTMAEALAAERTALIETFALMLARQCLHHPLVLAATVSVCKPAALDRGMAEVEVALHKNEPTF